MIHRAYKLIVVERKLVAGKKTSLAGVTLKAVGMINLIFCSHNKFPLTEWQPALVTFRSEQSENEEKLSSCKTIKSFIRKFFKNTTLG